MWKISAYGNGKKWNLFSIRYGGKVVENQIKIKYIYMFIEVAQYRPRNAGYVVQSSTLGES